MPPVLPRGGLLPASAAAAVLRAAQLDCAAALTLPVASSVERFSRFSEGLGEVHALPSLRASLLFYGGAPQSSAGVRSAARREEQVQRLRHLLVQRRQLSSSQPLTAPSTPTKASRSPSSTGASSSEGKASNPSDGTAAGGVDGSFVGKAEGSPAQVNSPETSELKHSKTGAAGNPALPFEAQTPEEDAAHDNASILYPMPARGASSDLRSGTMSSDEATKAEAKRASQDPGPKKSSTVFNTIASVGLFATGAGLILWGLGGGTWLITQNSQPATVTWDFVKEDPRVIEVMGTGFQRDCWWGGYEHDDSARVKLRLTGKDGQKGIVVCDLSRESKKDPWKIMVLNFMRIDDKQSGPQPGKTDKEHMEEVMTSAIALYPPQPDRKKQAEQFASGTAVDYAALMKAKSDRPWEEVEAQSSDSQASDFFGRHGHHRLPPRPLGGAAESQPKLGETAQAAANDATKAQEPKEREEKDQRGMEKAEAVKGSPHKEHGKKNDETKESYSRRSSVVGEETSVGIMGRGRENPKIPLMASRDFEKTYAARDPSEKAHIFIKGEYEYNTKRDRP
ncbi:hypothetical protein TGPRC2_297160 [Toxoplasma gondii TgCatPRC2]|uniref:Uncharacterized protein n=1 Tax=Toxoplasma gondii TgCatPRC2 TaxID=1130821 RepID=A0A151H244_TOXGO|nr:hypothetical protein TGPRC2_297160 [Toxoplasma gondii TgCatPRC2]